MDYSVAAVDSVEIGLVVVDLLSQALELAMVLGDFWLEYPMFQYPCYVFLAPSAVVAFQVPSFLG